MVRGKESASAAMERVVADLAAAAEQMERGSGEGAAGATTASASAKRKKQSSDAPSGGIGSGEKRSKLGSNDGETHGREGNAGKKATARGKGGGKRAKFNDKGELLMWYCCSCKQSLKPEDFDPGLETCRVCLAKRRAKDRVKKRLRGLQIKHHLLSADEKDVAAFLLGVYHPALGNHSGNQSTQMHVQTSSECTAFVQDMQKILEDRPKIQADEILRAFLGLDEHGNKLSKEVPREMDDGPNDASLKSKKNENKRARKSMSARLSTEQKQSLEKNLNKVFKKYGSLLAHTDKQTWVRFATNNSVEGVPAQGIKYSSPVHEQRVEIGTNEEHMGDVYSSIMQGVDPACSHFLYEFLFADKAPSCKQDGQNEDVDSNSGDGTVRPTLDDEELCLNSSAQYKASHEQTLDEQLNGNAYVFHGSLVMGWIGNSRTEKRELLSRENGILPDDLQPQALSRRGEIFDARNPNALVPLEETGGLHGFSDELALFPVIDSSRGDIRVQLPPGAFSESLGVRALHDGNYIDSEIRRKRNGGFELTLFPNGKSRQRSDVILLGAVQVQCFVRGGTAKELPIGNNLELLMIPSASHVTELQQGIKRIHETAGPNEARQFLSSMAYVLQHGDPLSQRFSFVLELAHVLELPKTLDLLNRIGALAKASSGSSDDRLSNCMSADAEPSLGDAHLVRNIFARPLVCLSAVFLQLFVFMSFASVNVATQCSYLIMMVLAAALSSVAPTRGALRLEAAAGVFVALFAGANASLLRVAGASLHDTYAFAVFSTFALSASHAHSYVGIIASICASHVSFWSLGFRPDALSTLAASVLSGEDVVPRQALLLHLFVLHVVFTIVIPFVIAAYICKPRFLHDRGDALSSKGGKGGKSKFARSTFRRAGAGVGG